MTSPRRTLTQTGLRDGHAAQQQEMAPSLVGSARTGLARKKRSLFGQLTSGVDAMRDHREGRLTLKATEVQPITCSVALPCFCACAQQDSATDIPSSARAAES